MMEQIGQNIVGGQPNMGQPMPVGQTPSPVQTPVQAPAQQFATPEQRQQLISLLEASKNKMADINTRRFAAANKNKSMKGDMLKSVFALLQSAGVDLSDVQSVSAWLEKLKTTNPELYAMTEEALVAFLDDGTEGQGLTDTMKNNYETIPEELQRPLS